jgi:hypothetical protein
MTTKVTAPYGGFGVDLTGIAEAAANGAVSLANVYVTGASGVTFSDFPLIRPLIKDASLTVQNPAVAATIALDLVDGNIVEFTRDATNITSMTFAGFLASEKSQFELHITAASGQGTLDLSGINKWIGGVAPTLSSTAGQTDTICVWSLDGGTTVIGAHIGTAS